MNLKQLEELLGLIIWEGCNSLEDAVYYALNYEKAYNYLKEVYETDDLDTIDELLINDLKNLVFWV